MDGFMQIHVVDAGSRRPSLVLASHQEAPRCAMHDLILVLIGWTVQGATPMQRRGCAV